MINIIWAFFFITAFVACLYQSIFMGNIEIWTLTVEGSFEMAKTAFEISLGLTGILCLWLGLLNIAKEAGITDKVSKFLSPLFHKLMPDVPKNHPAIGTMCMNMAANILGLDNAATPAGIKAMEELQEINPNKDRASNAQILFLVINTSSVMLLPISIFMYRTEMGASSPTAVFIPILIATSMSTLGGILMTAFVQKINIFNRVVLSYFAGLIAIILTIVLYFYNLPVEQKAVQSAAFGNFVVFAVMVCFVAAGFFKKIPVYETFVEGAKEGFGIAIKIIPYLVAMLVGISVFRSSGCLDLLLLGIEKFFMLFGITPDFVPALPTAFMKPFSGSGARAMMIETMQTYGADSLPAFLSSVIQGSTETTFYVLAVYFGAVKITKFRHAIPCALFADLVGIVVAIFVGYLFF
jgi:spore maturation protein SpmA